jgi:hypothetical protein
VYSLTRYVGFWGRSGNLVLDQSTTGFDPERNSDHANTCEVIQPAPEARYRSPRSVARGQNDDHHATTMSNPGKVVIFYAALV